MAQISGKYVMTNVAEFGNFLKQEGVPDAEIKSFIEGDQYLEIKVDGQKLSINEHHGDKDNVSNLVLGEEIEDKKPWGTSKITAKLEGNILTLDSKTADGKSLIKSYTFTGDQVELQRPSRRGGSGIKQIFKKA